MNPDIHSVEIKKSFVSQKQIRKIIRLVKFKLYVKHEK